MPMLRDKNGNVIDGLMLQAPMHSMDGICCLHKFGKNSDIDTTLADIWDGGGIWVAPTQARVHAVASVGADAAKDTMTSGTGAWEVELHGLDAAGLTQTELVELEGATPVNTNKEFLMIHRMYVTQAGSDGANQGDIKATAATDATVTAQISIGNNQTLMAIFQVPFDKDLYMSGYYAAASKGVTVGSYDGLLKIKPLGGVYQLKHTKGANLAGTSAIDHNFTPYLKVEGGSIIKMQADTSANDMSVSAGFDGIMVDTIIEGKL